MSDDESRRYDRHDWNNPGQHQKGNRSVSAPRPRPVISILDFSDLAVPTSPSPISTDSARAKSLSDFTRSTSSYEAYALRSPMSVQTTPRSAKSSASSRISDQSSSPRCDLPEPPFVHIESPSLKSIFSQPADASSNKSINLTLGTRTTTCRFHDTHTRLIIHGEIGEAGSTTTLDDPSKSDDEGQWRWMLESTCLSNSESFVACIFLDAKPTAKKAKFIGLIESALHLPIKLTLKYSQKQCKIVGKLTLYKSEGKSVTMVESRVVIPKA